MKQIAEVYLSFLSTFEELAFIVPAKSGQALLPSQTKSGKQGGSLTCISPAVTGVHTPIKAACLGEKRLTLKYVWQGKAVMKYCIPLCKVITTFLIAANCRKCSCLSALGICLYFSFFLGNKEASAQICFL